MPFRWPANHNHLNWKSYQREADIEYGNSADDYAVGDKLKWEKPSGTALALRSLCDEIRPRRVLELGTGTGRYFPFLTGSTYVGVDVCEPMLEQARQREQLLYERGFEVVTLARKEIHTFLAEEATEPFDLIFSIGCIGYHVPVTIDLMQAIGRLLAHQGHLFLQTTQQSLTRRIERKLKYWKNRLAGLDDNYAFFCSTTASELRHIAAQAKMETRWVNEDQAVFFDRPMLLALFKKDSA